MKRDPLLEAVLKDKEALREATAARPFAEKLRILERLRDRDAAIRAPAPERPRPR